LRCILVGAVLMSWEIDSNDPGLFCRLLVIIALWFWCSFGWSVGGSLGFLTFGIFGFFTLSGQLATQPLVLNRHTNCHPNPLTRSHSLSVLLLSLPFFPGLTWSCETTFYVTLSYCCPFCLKKAMLDKNAFLVALSDPFFLLASFCWF